MVTQRYLFALDMDKAVDRVSTSCHHCASLRTVLTTVVKQSKNPPPETDADVIKRAKQFILVLRECVTSYTVPTLFLTSATALYATPLLACVLTCDHWTVPLLLCELTPPQLYQTTEDALPPPTPPPVPTALSTRPSHPDTDTNLTSLPSPCNQPG